MLEFVFILAPFALLFLSVVFQFLMLANRKPGVGLFQARFLYIPFNIQFAGNYFLSEKGVFWRNLSWFCLLLIVILIGTGRWLYR